MSQHATQQALATSVPKGRHLQAGVCPKSVQQFAAFRLPEEPRMDVIDDGPQPFVG